MNNPSAGGEKQVRNQKVRVVEPEQRALMFAGRHVRGNLPCLPHASRQPVPLPPYLLNHQYFDVSETLLRIYSSWFSCRKLRLDHHHRQPLPPTLAPVPSVRFEFLAPTRVHEKRD